MRYNLSCLKSIMLNGLFHGPQGKCCLVLFLADELVTSKRFYVHFATVNHFQIFIQIGGNCIYTDSRI